MAFVLIVEDSDAATPLEIALASLKGLRTMLVTNGRDALKVIQENRIELAAIVTDLQLPFLDGFELIAAARTAERYKRLPIIVVSGNNEPENCIRVRQLGADAYFTNPYSPAEVRQTLEGLLHVP
jgi:CheY-like chemotaxis protein